MDPPHRRLSPLDRPAQPVRNYLQRSERAVPRVPRLRRCVVREPPEPLASPARDVEPLVRLRRRLVCPDRLFHVDPGVVRADGLQKVAYVDFCGVVLVSLEAGIGSGRSGFYLVIRWRAGVCEFKLGQGEEWRIF